MLRAEVFQPFHITLIRAQPYQAAELGEVLVHNHDRYRPQGLAFTGRDEHTGEVMVCGGVVPAYAHLGFLWALVSADAGPHLLQIHRAARRLLEMTRQTRIEASVRKDFEAGCRWLKILGFNAEGESPGFGIDGSTHLRYGLVRG